MAKKLEEGRDGMKMLAEALVLYGQMTLREKHIFMRCAVDGLIKTALDSGISFVAEQKAAKRKRK